MLYIVLFILYNLSLIYLNYRLFEYLIPNLYPCFIYVIVEVNVILSPQISDSRLFMMDFEAKRIAYKHMINFRELGQHSLREYNNAQNIASNLANIAPIMLREGKVGLHQCFVESSKMYQTHANQYLDDCNFFMRQTDYLMDLLW